MIIVGIDEAGRGCWAGPLAAAAVVLNSPIDGLRDSKKLTRKSRARLAGEIKNRAAAFGLGWASSAYIDEHGLTIATRKAMRMALEQIKIAYDQIIIDGNFNYLPDITAAEFLVRADSLVQEASAASILAKSSRDEYMLKLALQYPEYMFDRHVGYGTSLHLRQLRIHGACIEHRRSFKPIRDLEIIADD